MTLVTPSTNRSSEWVKRLHKYNERVQDASTLMLEGKLSRMVGLTLEAVGCRSPIGSRCIVETPDGKAIEAEVVGFSGERLYLMPIGDIRGLQQDCKVIPTGKSCTARVGTGLLGRVINGSGKPLDGKGPIKYETTVALNGTPTNPLLRKPIEKSMDVGVTAINAMTTIGRGQRMGLFAGSGVGKSVLLGMMTRNTKADVVVVGLIGERGREVNEFVRNILGEQGLKRSIVVASPADDPPLMRMHGALLSTSIAEYFRDQGADVLLLMDSITRFAQAQREIALAINEPPATKGYPPSVFAKLPHLVERAGNGNENQGSITAIYTVLTEGDDQQDPIADTARAILDGHIVLSRELADSGHFPAIDIESSVSRLMNEIVDDKHRFLARRLKQINSVYQQNRDLISVGAYHPGSDSKIDEAIAMRESISSFLQQDFKESVNFETSLRGLERLLAVSEDDQDGKQLIETSVTD